MIEQYLHGNTKANYDKANKACHDSQNKYNDVVTFVDYDHPLIQQALNHQDGALGGVPIALKDNDFRYYSIFYYTKKKQIAINHYWGISIQSFVPPQYDFESITIGNRCFIKAILFHINGLKQLKQVKIGNKSFSTKVSCCYKIGYSFHILNCPLLQSIEIGERSFYDYYGQFELSNLPALQSISIGSINNDSSNFVHSSFVIQSTSFHFVSFSLS